MRVASTAPPISVPKALCFWRTHMGLCGRCTACLPMGPFVATGRLSCAKYNHFPISRMFCLPQRKMRSTETGREVTPHGNSPVHLFAPAGLSCPSLSVIPLSVLSASNPLHMPLCLFLPFSLFNVYLSSSFCLSLYFSVSLFQSHYFSLFLSLLLFCLFLSLSPTSLSLLSFLSIFFFSSFLPLSF